MDFSEALQVLENGGKVKRAWWAEVGDVGEWIEIVSGTTSDGRAIKGIPMVWKESEKAFVPWGGALRDISGEDWEEVR